jgi:hypothetical protein
MGSVISSTGRFDYARRDIGVILFYNVSFAFAPLFAIYCEMI